MKTQPKIFATALPWLILGLSVSVPASAFAAKDACSLFTSADAEAALGEPVGMPRSEPRSAAGGEGSVCKFKSAQAKGLQGKSVSVTVHYSSTDLSGSTAGIKENLKSAGFKNVHEVPGAGDWALWGTTSVMGKPTGELTVIKGKTLMLVILINGVADESTALDRSKSLANRVLPKT